jgi:hypothetical protein
MFKLLFGLQWLPCILIAQNVGIGVASPTRGKFEVVNGAGGVATSIFGADGAGMSLEHNWPRVGYNTYWPGTGKYIAPGGGYSQYLNMTTGALIWEYNGKGANANSPTTAQVRQITFNQSGNTCICEGDNLATLFVGYYNLNITSARFRGTTYHSVFNDAALSGTRHTYINAGKNGGAVILNDITSGNIRIGISTLVPETANRVGINVDPTDVLDIKQVSSYGWVLINSNFYDWGLGVFKNLTEPGSDLYTFAGGAYRGNFFHIDGKYYPGSDRRLKTNIKPLPSLLDRIMALRPVEYEMKYHNPGHLKSIGFIAQEVKPLFPELTSYVQSSELGYEGMTDLYSMSYDGLGPLAVKAIQEQQQTLKQLKQQNEWLRHRLEAAEKMFASLQNQ